VSYSIIERHSGSIKVESELGRGTTFTIELPATETPLTTLEELICLPESTPLSILVVDDEASVRETLADMLTALHHKVALADSGRAAVEMSATTNFDLVFTDLAMPEMDGWETARALRKHGRETTIVLVTGYGVGTAPPVGENELIDAVIGKPFDFDQVSEVIARLFVSSASQEPEPALA
jgi:CheY-like chemotaxis protein